MTIPTLALIGILGLDGSESGPADTRRMDAIVRAYSAQRQFSGSVLVARKGKVLFERAYGMANWDLRRPNTISTKHRLGSVTKQFTAAGVMRLVEEGKLKLDDSITTHLADAPSAWQPVTIRHLLHHESGIPDIVDLPDYQVFKLQSHSRSQLMGRFASLPLLFSPGSKHRYSNSGYIVLGLLIEKISEKPYGEFLQEKIFDPAGMASTGCDSSSSVIFGRASGYVATEDGFAPAPFINMSVPFSAGSLYSTTADLLKWETALFGHKVLRPSSVAVMLAPYQGIKRAETGIGMGLAIDDSYGRRQIFFGGGVEGFNAWLAYDPATETVIAALSNVTTPWLEDMCGQLGAVSRGEKVVLTAERKEVQIDEGDLRKFVGAYAISESLNMNIGFESGRLYVQVDGQDRFPFYAEAPTRFFLKVLDAQGEFVANDRGTWDLMWHQGGTKTRFPRR